MGKAHQTIHRVTVTTKTRTRTKQKPSNNNRCPTCGKYMKSK